MKLKTKHGALEPFLINFECTSRIQVGGCSGLLPDGFLANFQKGHRSSWKNNRILWFFTGKIAKLAMGRQIKVPLPHSCLDQFEYLVRCYLEYKTQLS